MSPQSIPLAEISCNPWQTRMGVDTGHIQALADDIKTNGLLQIPVGRWTPAGEEPPSRCQLAFGHNRLEAYRLLAKDDHSFAHLPVEIRDLDDEHMADIAWSENERRQDLTPIERALAIQRRIVDFSWTHEQVAVHLGISRSLVSNALRLLNLPDDIQDRISDRTLSERQAVALLTLYNLPEPLQVAAENGWQGPAKPSNIVGQAISGASSDAIRDQVGELVGLYGKKLGQWPLTHEFDALGGRGPCSKCDLRLEKDGQDVCGDPDCFSNRVSAYNSRPSETQPTTGAPAPQPEPIPSQSSPPSVSKPHTRPVGKPQPKPQPQPEPPPPPPTWDESTINASLTWFPLDPKTDKRLTMVAMRVNEGLPKMRTLNGDETSVEALINQMVDELREEYEIKNKESQS